MFCPNCGLEIKDDAAFCPKCGKRTGERPPEEPNDYVDLEAPNYTKQESRLLSTVWGRALLFGWIVAVVLVVVIICVSVSKGNNTGILTIYDPPPEPNELFKSSFVVGDKTSEPLSASEWIPNDGYVITKVTETNRNKFTEGGADQCTISLTVEYENGWLKATKHVNETFSQRAEDGGWNLIDTADEGDTTVTPIKGVDSARVMVSVPTLIDLADEHPKKNADGYAVLLRECYKDGTSFEVKENETTANGGDVAVSLHASRGFADYDGTLTASFVWNGESWVLDSCKADDAAYQADYISLVGTWNGEFQKTEHNDVMDQAACYGGKNHPAVLTIKSVDSGAKTATADISVLVHDHSVPENTAEEYSGDSYVTRENILFEIDPNGQTRIYQSDDPTSFDVKLSFDKGQMNLSTYVEASFAANHSVAWRRDTYKMVKQDG